jgi:hypothetical protein
MRTSWLALTALLLFAAPGCGDDTATSTDMAVSNDMAMTAPTDMNKATCATQITCGTNCILHPMAGVSLMQCGLNCAMPLAGKPKADFLTLEGCILQTCTNDGGIFDPTCAGASIAKNPPGVCYGFLTTCQAE